MQTPPSPGWRKPSVPSSHAAPTATPVPHGWRNPISPASPGPGLYRLLRLVGVIVLAVAIATLLIWLVLWLRPPAPAVLLLAGAGYENNLAVPANPQGRAAMDRFAVLASRSTMLSEVFSRAGRLRALATPREYLRGGDWARGLESVQEKTVIVFLALHGASDPKGPYLLPHDSTGDESDRLRIESVIKRLGELPADRNKILILDATCHGANWSHGSFGDDFAAGLAGLETQIAAVPNLVVLSSSDLHQRSWPAADGRTTLFMRHVLHGIAGAASPSNGNLNALQLFRHVKARVADEALHQRGAVQTPVLLPTNGGEDRAQAIPLTFRLTSEDAPADGDSPIEALPDIESARVSLDAFASAPAAAACVPRDWRLWRAWLTRYSHLRLSGSPHAADVLAKVTEAEDNVRRHLAPQLNSTYHTLAQPSLVGETKLEITLPYAPLDRLWNKTQTERDAFLKEFNKGSLAKSARNRRDLLQAIVQKAGSAPARDLEQAALLARLLDDPVRPMRPAEVQFLTMLARDLPDKSLSAPLAEAIALALRVRLVAERSALCVPPSGHAYAERIWPHIRPTIRKADELRQAGQDLLFASAEDWENAKNRLSDAFTTYQQADQQAAILRDALAARDAVLADLPEHAAWIAGVRMSKTDDMVLLSESLFARTWELDALLGDPEVLSNPRRKAELQKVTSEVKKGMSTIQSRLDATARKCEGSNPACAADALVLLTAPGLKNERRQSLVARLDRLDYRARKGDVSVSWSADQESQHQRDQALAQARMALAALGRDGFRPRDDHPSDGHLTFDEAAAKLQAAEPTFDLVAFGDRVGDHFRAWDERVKSRVVSIGRLAEKQSPAPALAEPDALTRRLDAGQCQNLWRDRDAADLYRRANLQLLLVWQAERTWRDHWYGDNGMPYYRDIGTDMLIDVKRLQPFDPTIVPSEAEVRERLKGEDEIQFEKSQTVHLIPGERLRLVNALRARSKDIVGHAITWVEATAKLQWEGEKISDQPGSKKTSDRLVQDIGPDARPRTLVALVASPELDKAEERPPSNSTPEPSAVQWKAYFRGLDHSRDTTVQLHYAPPLTRSEFSRPPTAGVALRCSSRLADRLGEAQGALAVVLDCSGSLAPGKEQPPEKARFRLLTEALKQALKRVPKGTIVSVWVFGQGVGETLTAVPESTIERLQAPVIWSGKQEDTEALVAKAEALTPWNQSPVVRTMIRAKQDVIAAEGFRALLVLTDGEDNRIAKDTTANPEKLSVPELLKKSFAGTAIQVHMIGFQPSDKEEAAARKQFEELTKITKGTYSTVSQMRFTLEALERLMKPDLRYRLQPVVKSREKQTEILRDIARDGENDRWQEVPVSRPEAFRLSLAGGRGPGRRLLLGPGDHLLLRLTAPAGKAEVERLLYAEDEVGDGAILRQTPGWLAAVLQNQQQNGGLQMLFTLEKRLSDEEDALQQYRPREVWLELGLPKGEKANPTVRWSEAESYPAPAWSVDVPAWPEAGGGPVKPTLNLWWMSGRPLSVKTLIANRDFSRLPSLQDKEVPELDGPVRIDGATIEQRWVWQRNGDREKRWCLVVRATTEPSRVIRVQPEGLHDLAGQEHRFYPEAGRYEGLFWYATLTARDLVEDRVESDLTALQVLSINGVKREAVGWKNNAEFRLDAPGSRGRPRSVKQE